MLQKLLCSRRKKIKEISKGERKLSYVLFFLFLGEVREEAARGVRQIYMSPWYMQTCRGTTDRTRDAASAPRQWEPRFELEGWPNFSFSASVSRRWHLAAHVSNTSCFTGVCDVQSSLSLTPLIPLCKALQFTRTRTLYYPQINFNPFVSLLDYYIIISLRHYWSKKKWRQA